MADPIMVYPLVSQWHFNSSVDSLSGTRVYLDGSAKSILNGITQVELPRLGDEWDDDYPNITCKSIDTTYLNDNDNCPKKFICAYDGIPYTQTAVSGNENDLPKNVSIGGENRAFEPKNNLWKWASNNDNIVHQNISKRTIVANINIVRIVKDFDEYMKTVFGIAGKINQEIFLGFPVGTVLFIGANMSEFRNKIGSKRWSAELVFQVKSVNGRINSGVDNADGWTYSLREDGKVGYIGGWDRPYIPGSPKIYLYDYAIFNPLFEGHQLGDSENMYPVIPDK
jgi:hypothetical protein